MHDLLHSPLAILIIQAIAIIATARAIGLLARRMRQPMVIAEVVAGILLGPSFLGWLAPNFSAALFPKESLAALSLLSQVGLIFFMFLVGLEFDTGLLRGRGHTSIVISHTSIIVPFALGALIARQLYTRLSDPAVPFSSFTLFMGVAMSITAFPVLARILVERRLMQSRVGAVTITCAAVDDVTAWCILAFIVAIVRVASLAQAARTTIYALVYIALMIVVVRPFLRRLGKRSANREGLNQNLIAVTLILVLASSLMTEMIGIHALFGAFILGAVIPKTDGFARILAERLEDLVVVVLLPLFFAYSGLRTQIGLLDSAPAWGICALIIAVACLGKFGGSSVAAWLTGLRWREAAALGILMNTRGLIELIVLNIGLDLGVLSPTLFTMLVLMALVTTFMTTPLLAWFYPESELAAEEAPMAEELAAVPGFTVLMCVAYDRSGPAMVTLAGGLAGHGDDGDRLYALRLIPPTDRASFVLDQRRETPEAAALSPLLGRAQELALTVRPLAFVSPRPAEDICNIADVKHADLILLGWHKPLLGNAALGGTVHEVMRHAHAEVGVLVDRGLGRIERVLVPYLGSVHDRGALRLGERLARNTGARVTVLHVVSGGSHSPSAGVEADLDRLLQEARDRDRQGGRIQLTLKSLAHTDPAEAVLQESARGYDLVIIGVGSEWGLEHRVFGVHSEHVIRSCPTSLLVVREGQTVAAPPSVSPMDVSVASAGNR